MLEQLNQIRAQAQEALQSATDAKSIEAFRHQFLGKKGALATVGAEMRHLSAEEKPEAGRKLQEVRGWIAEVLEEKERALQVARDREALQGFDDTLPAPRPARGSLHPMTILLDRAISVLRRLGFSLASGPDIETEWHCFDALNTPPDHPARNEKDTFYFGDGSLLRTHTSTVQIRTMQRVVPPVRIIAPGAAYRRDEIDATHSMQFTQIEGLYVNRDVNLGHLKGTLEYLFQGLFGEDTQVRLRPHFFPFTEPSFEIDIQLHLEGQEGKWIEIAGCGMVDPAVFEAICDARGDRVYDPEVVSGFAFGMGLDRLAMIAWSIPDIRLFSESDQRFLAQFSSL